MEDAENWIQHLFPLTRDGWGDPKNLSHDGIPGLAYPETTLKGAWPNVLKGTDLVSTAMSTYSYICIHIHNIVIYIYTRNYIHKKGVYIYVRINMYIYNYIYSCVCVLNYGTENNKTRPPCFPHFGLVARLLFLKLVLFLAGSSADLWVSTCDIGYGAVSWRLWRFCWNLEVGWIWSSSKWSYQSWDQSFQTA